MFTRKKKQENKEHPTLKDRLTDKMATAIVRLQKAFGDYMNAKTKHFSPARWKLLLTLFCLFFLGCTWYIITGAFSADRGKNLLRHTGQMRIPTNNSFSEKWNNAVALSANDLKRIRAFKKYMDSIRTHNRPLFDSIRQQRPGLLDSIQTIENIYRSHNKN